MRDGEERGARGDVGGRRVVYCLVPSELAPKLHDLLRSHFRDDPEIEVLVEQRHMERRQSAERRSRDTGPPSGGERRRIRSATGRRVGERRTPVVTASAPALPRRARRYAEQLRFVERLEPSTTDAEDLDTARLVARFQAGDADAFTTLYLRYFGRVYSYLRAVFRESHEAEDAAQQVFMKVFESLSDYEHRGSPFRVWLFVIARNLARTQLRKLSRVDVSEPAQMDRLLDADPVQEQQAPPPDLDWISDHDLMLFVERLPEAQRQVLTLRYLLDLSNIQIAEILGRTPNDVAVLQKRALAFIRQRLAAVNRRSHGRGPARMRAWNPQAPVLRSRRFSLVA